MTTDKRIIRELASGIMDLADRKSWGLGECRWDLNRDALDSIEECDVYLGLDDSYDAKKEGDDACTGDHEAHIKEAKRRSNAAYELACMLQDHGITTFR